MAFKWRRLGGGASSSRALRRCSPMRQPRHCWASQLRETPQPLHTDPQSLVEFGRDQMRSWAFVLSS